MPCSSLRLIKMSSKIVSFALPACSTSFVLKSFHQGAQLMLKRQPVPYSGSGPLTLGLGSELGNGDKF